MLSERIILGAPYSEDEAEGREKADDGKKSVWLAELGKKGKGLMRWKERAWTKEEVALLKEFYPLGSKREILGKINGRSWSAIVGKASSLKIRRLRPSEPFP